MRRSQEKTLILFAHLESQIQINKRLGRLKVLIGKVIEFRCVGQGLKFVTRK
jgi:hypothetical protein